MNNYYLLLFLFLVVTSCTNRDKKQLPKDISSEVSYDTLIRNQKIKDANTELLNSNINAFYKISSNLEKQATLHSDTSGILYSRMNLGYYFSEIYQIDSAYYYLTSAEKISKKTKSKELLEYILQYKADVFWFQKNYVEAQSYSIKALNILKKNKNPQLEHTCYVTIANSLERMNKNKEALKYYNKALENIKHNDVTFENAHTSILYSYMASIFEKQNNPTKSLEFIKKGLSYSDLKKSDIKVYCYLKNQLGKSIYKTQKNEALSIYSETLKIGDSIDFAPIQITSQIQLGELYLHYKDTIKANIYLHKAKELAHQKQAFDDELMILKLLTKSNSELSHDYTDRYIHLNDSLQNVERDTRDKFARIEFETDEILKQKNHIENQNRKLNTQLLLALGSALLSVVSIYLFFKNKSNKTKINELKLIQEKQELENKQLLFIQEQQLKDEKMYQILLEQQDKIEEAKQTEKKRISRELHDGIMGKLSGIRLNLYILKKKTDPETIARCLEFIKDIQTIENDLRLLSHDLNKESLTTVESIENEIKTLFREIKNLQDIDFKLHIDKNIIWENIKYNLKINMYRIIQEALHNINKYAEAKKVTISISQNNQYISVEINDDGKGFDLNKHKEGIGLKNMRERTEELQGTFTIESKPNNGTKINLLLPI